MEYLKRGLSKTVDSIKKHKGLFLALVLLQVIFVVSSLWLGSQYLIKILEDTQGIIGPLENANYDSQKIEQGQPFTPDYAAIYNSYQSMLKNVLVFAAWIAALFLILNGSIWLLSHWMLQEQKQWKLRMKEGAQFLVKAWASAFLLLGPFTIISYFILLHFIRVSQSFSDIALVLKSLLVALWIAYYFFLAALAAAPIRSWKRFAAIWIRISVKEFRKTTVLFVSIMAALLASFAALYAAVEYTESVVLLLPLGLLCMLMLNATRLFWIASIQEIENMPTT
ncbi:MAG: hypothetical protein Q8R47_02930 [Nanoarchaeota archaeon]|nr:hypothetical protein [Nanoarchaeota archaeon]